LLAGDVAEAIVDGTAAALPPRDDLLTYLRLAKKDEHGNCDNCKISAMIVDVAPNASDDILADVWLDSYRECVEFFAHPDVCAALDRLAEALREHQLLTGEQIAELVDAEALQAARASLETI
jgi:hypothetical protein